MGRSGGGGGRGRGGSGRGRGGYGGRGGTGRSGRGRGRGRGGGGDGGGDGLVDAEACCVGVGEDAGDVDALVVEAAHGGGDVGPGREGEDRVSLIGASSLVWNFSYPSC